MSKQSKLTENLKKMKGFCTDVNVAADMAYKNDYMVNSFFAIGHFEVKGHILNYLLHLMVNVSPEKGTDLTFCFSITDETERKYVQFSKAYPLSEIEIAADRFFIRTPAGSMEGDIKSFHMMAQMNRASLNLTLSPIGYPLYNGGTGKFHMLGMDIHEYSLPTMLSNGTIVLDGEYYSIENEMSWFDRQWQIKLSEILPALKGPIVTSKFNEQPLVWGWMDINLENDDKISVWLLKEKDGDCWATVMHPSGAQRTIDVTLKTSEPWQSPNSGNVYPMVWKVTIPELEAELTIKTVLNDQELFFSKQQSYYNHYEGASVVNGIYYGRPTTGYCYVELLGNWGEA